jgi:hypothetical protein
MMRERRKAAAHFFRRGVGGDVEILGLGADQQVAHGAADDVGLVAVASCRVSQTRRLPRTDAVAGDAVGGDGNDGGLMLAGLGLFAAENAGNEFADHELPFWSAKALRGKAPILPQSDDFPAHFATVLAQRVIRIDGHRRLHLAHQRQVVVRVAVEKAVFKTAHHRPSDSSQASTRSILPSRKEGVPRGAPENAPVCGSTAAIVPIRCGNAEGAGNRAGHEAVGGGDDGAQVAVVEVLLDDITGFAPMIGQDVALHVFAVPGIEFGARNGGSAGRAGS